jgi:hypothetical protein
MPDPPQPEQPRQRTQDEIEQELVDTAQRLASRVDELVGRLSPKNVVRRQIAGLREKVAPDGRPRAEVVGAAVGALVGIAVLVWRSRRHR